MAGQSVFQVRRDVRDRPIKKVAIYLRVSSDEQAKGRSPDSQESEVRKFARQQRWRMVAVYRDVPHDGNTMERPGIRALEEAGRRGEFDAILVKNVKRLARCPTANDWLDGLLNVGVRFRSVQEPHINETPSGVKFQRDAVAEAEKDNADRADQIAGGMADCDMGGFWARKCWFGYKPSGRKDAIPVPDKRLSALMVQAFHDVDAGLPMAAVRAKFSRAGVTMSQKRLRERLADPKYCGYWIKKGTRVPKCQWKPIIDEDLFDRVQTRLKRRRSEGKTTYQCFRPEYWLRGLVRCTCGRPLTASASRGRHGYYPRYHCPACGASVVLAEMEERFATLVAALTADLPADWPDRVRQTLSSDVQQARGERQRARARVEELKTQRQSLAVRFAAADDDDIQDALAAELKNVQRELRGAEEALSIAVDDEALIERGTDDLIAEVATALDGNLPTLFRVLRADVRRALAEAIFPVGIRLDQSRNFGTAVTGSFLCELAALREAKEGLVELTAQSWNRDGSAPQRAASHDLAAQFRAFAARWPREVRTVLPQIARKADPRPA